MKVLRRIMWIILLLLAFGIIGTMGYYINQDVTLPIGVPKVGQH